MSEEYEVLYDWEPENPEDLRIFAGETIVVLQKHDHGWWLGSIDRDGDVVKGYFPKNYVKEKPKVAAAPPPPPRPVSLSRPPQADVGKLASDMSALSTNDAPQSQQQQQQRRAPARGFSLKSLPAFDDLMSKGFAVELNAPDATGTFPQHGDEVVLQCTAMTWDGALGGAKEYASGDLHFIIGNKTVVPGLEAAVLAIPVGQGATVTCSPSMAYGNAGFPPSVPPNSFVVFQVVIKSATRTSNPDSKVRGPAQLFVADLPAHRRLTIRDERDRLVLDPATSSTTADSPTTA